MITANSLDELESKLEQRRKKALKVNPRIEIVETGLYNVEGSKGKWYEVRCGRNEQGEFFIACRCLGALHTGGCYHAAQAFYKHKELKALEIRLRQNAEQDNAPYLKLSSDKKPEKCGNFRI